MINCILNRELDWKDGEIRREFATAFVKSVCINSQYASGYGMPLPLIGNYLCREYPYRPRQIKTIIEIYIDPHFI